MQTTQVYAVERVYEDLRPQFVAKDIIKQLAQLDAVVGDIFNRLAHKVGLEKDRVAAVDRRIHVCQAKVNALTERRTSNKPTTVFSTSKYPAPKVLPSTKTLFHDKPYADGPIVVPDVDDDTHFLPAEPLAPAQRVQLMNDVVELYEQVNAFQVTQRAADVDTTHEGLGRLPEYIPSIGSVLLFNSGENPYQKYTSWDNLLGTDYEEEDERRKELASAPKTLRDGDELPSVSGLSFDFQPTPGAIEDLSKKLPANLPLSGIVSYNYESRPGENASIAPSWFQTNKTALPDLPPVADFAAAPSAMEPSSSAQIGPLDGPPPPPPPGVTVAFSREEDDSAMPPPPPPMQLQDDNDDSTPPPPPPPMMMHRDAYDDDAPPPPPPAPMGGMHDDAPPSSAAAVKNPVVSLLDEIQNPGLKLRKVTPGERKPTFEPATDASSRTANKPMTAMEEMKERMRRRQEAISGKQDLMEQKRDRELFAKRTPVLTAKEVTAPSSSSSNAQPPPPPPPAAAPTTTASDSDRRNRLPSVEMSDDDNGSDSDDSNSDFEASVDGENDLLAQIRSIKEKQDAGEGAKKPVPPPAARPTPKTEETTPPLMAFETQMVGLRDRADSLSMSEASDWSD